MGRASPLYFAERLTEKYGTADIYLKREDLNHTGRARTGGLHSSTSHLNDITVSWDIFGG